ICILNVASRAFVGSLKPPSEPTQATPKSLVSQVKPSGSCTMLSIVSGPSASSWIWAVPWAGVPSFQSTNSYTAASPSATVGGPLTRVTIRSGLVGAGGGGGEDGGSGSPGVTLKTWVPMHIGLLSSERL